MKTIIVLLSLIALPTFSQTYYSKYYCKQANFYSLKDTLTGDHNTDPFLELLGNGVIEASYEMHVISNCDHAFVTLIPLKISHPLFQVTSNDKEFYVIDFKRKITYDFQLKNNRIYDLKNQKTAATSENDSSYIQTLTYKKATGIDSAYVTYSKKLPKCQTAMFILPEAAGGLTSAKTNRLFVNLTMCKDTNNNVLSAKVEEAKKICSKMGTPKNFLFR